MADTKISALGAVTLPAGTQEVPVNDSGTTKKVTLAQIWGAGSATAGSWPKMTPGTLLTTAEDGAIEMDADCLYATTDGGNRGQVPVRHIIRADSTRTFTSNTSSQAIFTSPAGGTLTLETGTYLMHGLLVFTAMSATSGNLLFNVLGAGGATLAAQLFVVNGVDAATATAAASGGSHYAANSSPASVVLAATGTGLGVQMEGTFEVSAAGTIIPSITMVTASASVLSVGSYLIFERIGSQSLVSVGQWT
jgi:hypothetical protein